ncbi:MAG: UDP-glucuronate 4-epimerase, partial [Gaiellales bacterium]|nr:UDP-glucuronate 4-epimerase [Gaiellales bacterium]
HRLRLLLEDGELAALDQVHGDVTDLEQLRSTMEERDITHVIHLAALQVPFVRANPPLGASVNVVGTVVVFEAVRALGPLAGTLTYASSIAAYDPPQPGHEYEQRGTPATLYGVFKRANEETAGVYWADYRIPSIGLRPHTVYGLGRDQGVTSAATKAMLAAASGTSFQIPYGGRAELQHARDVARQFIAASRAAVEGNVVLDPPGQPVAMAEVVAAIHAAVPGSAETVGFDDVVSMGVPEQGDTAPFVALLGDLRTVPLREGVAETIESFRSLLARGLVEPPPAA